MNKYLEKIRRLVLDFVGDEPAKVYLFGSWARGEQKISSDVDIAIDFVDKEKKHKIFLLRELFEESAIPYRIDIVDMNFVSENLKGEILKEGILWKK